MAFVQQMMENMYRNVLQSLPHDKRNGPLGRSGVILIRTSSSPDPPISVVLSVACVERMWHLGRR